MLKQTVTYTDFDNKPAEEELYFNLTKTEIADNLDLKDEVERIQKSFEGEQRILGADEVRAMMELVKRLIRLAYGVRSADGKRFVKTQEQWTEFTQTAVYDEFLFSLFAKPDTMFTFILGIMPQDIRGEAEAMARAQANQDSLPDESESPRVIENATLRSVTVAPDGLGEIVSVTPSDDRPAWIRENREPTDAEIRAMPPEELREAFARKMRTQA